MVTKRTPECGPPSQGGRLRSGGACGQAVGPGAATDYGFAGVGPTGTVRVARHEAAEGRALTVVAGIHAHFMPRLNRSGPKGRRSRTCTPSDVTFHAPLSRTTWKTTSPP